MTHSRLRALAAAAALAVSTVSAFAEAGTLRVAKQYGLGYLQFMVMEDQKMIEKHAKAAGLGDVTVDWGTFRSSDVMNDALISRNLDFACLGHPGLITIWSKTRGNYDVRAAAGLNVLPLILNVRDPSIRSLKDFKDEHRIALPAVKVSMQAIILQMAVAKEFGEANFGKLDHLTVSLAHPDATAMMLSGKGEIVANFSSSPFQYRQQKQGGIRQMFTSEEVLGGPVSFNVIATTAKFREENPKLYRAFLAAFQEATDFVNKDKAAAAEIYLKLSSDKTPKEEIVELMSKPGVRFTTELFGLDKFADFMAKTGALKNPPKDWRAEMTFPEAK
ncbi:MAG TPA: ABC transporter substrate-binding protein [Beijerinckiaceae bacterium]|jgi:NitT/TauT family transport system substrate-binding protein